MEPDDLLCLRNARPQKDRKGAARCPSCSQNAHGETVRAREKSASRALGVGRVRKSRAVKGNLGHSPKAKYRESDGSRSG